MAYSVLILTHNEADNLPGCLASVRESDDVVVLDSGSTDGTVAIAQDAGVRVFYRPFDSFAEQRNFALREIPFKYPWVFQLDADERFSPDLFAECRAAAAEDVYSGYFVANRIMFLGRWIRHASQYPYYQLRFIKVGETEYSGGGHGQYAGTSKRGFGYLKTAYTHYNFSKGIDDWVAKHNRYAAIEAALAEERREPIRWESRVITDSHTRKRWLKQVYYRLPFRPWLKFFYLLIVCGGIWDGRPGWIYCRLVFLYEYLIWVKGVELRYRKAGGSL